ncbi:FlgO family outer membrane protein [Bowmanella sp. JS7-9]|uniref:FlgO family outer membrane protein n=1 Tax=Pseudobowmanella zhangzhouensis TaxID=1537679 RepID=A0ABW1XKC4_9ALTE|nr:FlgO family outer membrane protein [Bowmanella sp. JS7-9]TBX22558.1 lipoprotein [Bowmanella sp. JS7-9]
MIKQLPLACVLMLTGCASWDMQSWLGQDETVQTSKDMPATAQPMRVVNVREYEQDENGDKLSLDAFGNPASNSHLQRGGYLSQYTGRHIGDYVQSLTQDLVSNMEYVSDKTPIGVTHFALLDSDLQQTNLLGLQMAESFMHELHKFRIPVVDFKSTDYIRITPQGDFFLTRDFLELDGNVGLNYILTGTLAKHSGGYMVNARVLGMKSKAVVATAQMLIPFHVVDAILGEGQQSHERVNLKQG